MNSIDKFNLRSQIWNILEKKKMIRGDSSCYGRIPNFKGARLAAEKLSHTSEWKNSSTIFCSPDSAQREVREYALKDMKYLIIASPRLKQGYILIEPSKVHGKEKEASFVKGAIRYGEKINQFPEVDLVVEGSVAVDLEGNRLGKGGGYGDQEIYELLESRAINRDTIIVSTLDEAQILEKVFTEPHDQKINMVVTSKVIIRMNRISLLDR
jgi:5-formyltetrahydrofolate cyclo-ligase